MTHHSSAPDGARGERPRRLVLAAPHAAPAHRGEALQHLGHLRGQQCDDLRHINIDRAPSVRVHPGALKRPHPARLCAGGHKARAQHRTKKTIHP